MPSLRASFKVIFLIAFAPELIKISSYIYQNKL